MTTSAGIRIMRPVAACDKRIVTYFFCDLIASFHNGRVRTNETLKEYWGIVEYGRYLRLFP
jgi:hypothetical protein